MGAIVSNHFCTSVCVHGIDSRKVWQKLVIVGIVPLLLAVSRIEVRMYL